MKITLTILFMAIVAIAKGQSSPPDSIVLNGDLPYHVAFDSVSTGLIKSRIPYGVLFPRVAGWSGGADRNTDTLNDVFDLYQAWYDMEVSTVYPSTISTYNEMKHLADSMVGIRQIPLMLVDFNYSYFDTLAIQDGRLSVDSNQIVDNNLTQHPYVSERLTRLGFQLYDAEVDQSYSFSLDVNAFTLSNTDLTITSAYVEDVSNGYNFTLLPGQSSDIIFTTVGDHYITTTITFSDATTISSVSRVRVKEGLFRVSAGADCEVEHHLVESDITFKGYEESYGTTTWGDYHILYHYDQNGDCERILKKPILIMDGYDPQDENSWTVLYESYLKYQSGGIDRFFGEELRHLGYDVVILNFPKLGTEVPAPTDNNAMAKMAVPSYVHKNSVGAALQLDGNSYNGRDGGTDYIELNAFLVVKVIQELNARLAAISSTEKLVVVGPSMGGQISRYALAYMEQQSLNTIGIDPKTRLWISFDSPHWGANIPLATQRTMQWFGEKGQTAAQDAYNTKIYVPAGRQLLIEQLGEQNNGGSNSFRNQYMSSLRSNGLSGSYGWPSGSYAGGSIRKVSLLNGNGSGVANSTPGHHYLDGKGYKSSIKVFSLDGYYLPSDNTTAKYFSGRITSFDIHVVPILRIVTRINFNNNVSPNEDVTNYNPRGSMDVVQGSTYPSTEALKIQFSEELDKENVSNNWTYDPSHTFIPSWSAMAMAGGDGDWNDPIPSTVICHGEVPWDNYYIPPSNEPHITLTEANVAWLKAEITPAQTSSCPSRICPFFFSNYCSGTTTTESINNPSNVNITWTAITLPSFLQSLVHTAGITVNSYSNTQVNYTVVSNNGSNSSILVGQIDDPCGAPYSYGYTFNAYGCKGQTPNSGIADDLSSAPQEVQKYVAEYLAEHPIEKSATSKAIPEFNASAYVIPNPSSTAWTFYFPSPRVPATSLNIIDASGKKIKNIALSPREASYRISCEHLAPGTYFATITYKDGTRNLLKVVKM